MELNFDIRGFETVYDLSFTRRLFNTMEEQLKEVHQKTVEEFEEESDITDEEDYSIFRSTLNSFEERLEEEQFAVRSSHLIRLYSLFEIHAQKHCEVVASENKLDLRLKDFSGKEGMVKSIKLFLSKYAKLLPSDDRIWHELNNLRVIRNHLVHHANYGWHRYGTPQLIKIAQNEPKLPIIQDGKVTLPKEACEHLHSVVTEFFKLAFQSIDWRTFEN